MASATDGALCRLGWRIWGPPPFRTIDRPGRTPRSWPGSRRAWHWRGTKRSSVGTRYGDPITEKWAPAHAYLAPPAFCRMHGNFGARRAFGIIGETETSAHPVSPTDVKKRFA